MDHEWLRDIGTVGVDGLVYDEYFSGSVMSYEGRSSSMLV
jgi:hypothetical protein